MSQGIITSTNGFFQELVDEAVKERSLRTLPLSQNYIATLLEQYLLTDRLFDEEDEAGRKRRETLAIIYLKASQTPPPAKNELLKKLGDVSLYVSGFFGDSLKRKVNDVDYYVGMGGSAYGQLAAHTADDLYSQVYRDFSQRFIEYVDLLAVISRRALQQKQDLLRTYDLFASTGSRLAEDDLKDQGLLSQDLKKLKSKPQ